MAAQRFGPYELQGLVGRGGMGEVHRAYDTEHRRTVALKVLHGPLASDVAFRERFRREAFLAAGLSEPHVIPIHRYGEIEGRLFLDMRLVDGEGLDTRLERTTALDPHTALGILGQIAAALDAAHAAGLVHRDVKPSNILLTGRPEAPFAYLVDFGIARSTADPSSPALTRDGEAIGSLEYMAPERFLGRPPSPAMDVYALACVLYECLTGRRAFSGDDLPVIMYAHLDTSPPPPSTVRPGLPPALDAVLADGLAKDPGSRPPSAGALVARAGEALSAAGTDHAPSWRQADTTTAQPPPPPPGPTPAPTGESPPGRRRRTAVLAAVAALVAVALVLAFSLLGERDPTAGSGTAAERAGAERTGAAGALTTGAKAPTTAAEVPAPPPPAPVPTDAVDPSGAASAENCFTGILTACDRLFQPRYDPVYVEYGSTCGGRAPATGGQCLEYFWGEPTSPEGLGSDPALDELARACFDAEWQACNRLHEEAEAGSFYQAYGRHCGGRLPDPVFVYGVCEEIER